MLERFRVDGKAAVVTGGGRGIGAACALALAEAGADVVLAARTESQLDEMAHEVEAFGRKAITVPCDVKDNNPTAALAQRAVGWLGRLDNVVNNTGCTQPRPF